MEFLSPGDVYSLFGNTFDNTIDCLKNEESDKRIISLIVQSKGKFLCIRMENFCGDPLKFEDGLPVTNKPDKDYHGFGMKSMRYITEKYGGNLLAEQYDEMFSVNIVLPLSQKEKRAA